MAMSTPYGAMIIFWRQKTCFLVTGPKIKKNFTQDRSYPESHLYLIQMVEMLRFGSFGADDIN